MIDRLKVFTFLTRAEIEEYERLVAEEPFRRAAQKRLALEVTTLVHGSAAVDAAILASEALFGQGDSRRSTRRPSKPRSTSRSAQAAFAGASIAQLLVDAGLVQSLGESRRAIKQGGVYVNNAQVEAEDAVLEADQLLHGSFAVLRRGKKTLAAVRA